MLNVPIRSRSGNWFLAFIGAIYVVAALYPIVGLLRDAWHMRALTDFKLLFLLTMAAGAGIWFISIALSNLGVMHRDERRAH